MARRAQICPYFLRMPWYSARSRGPRRLSRDMTCAQCATRHARADRYESEHEPSRFRRLRPPRLLTSSQKVDYPTRSCNTVVQCFMMTSCAHLIQLLLGRDHPDALPVWLLYKKEAWV